MTHITVNASRRYDVLVGNGLSRRAGELIAAIHTPCRAVIVTDSNVAPLLLPVVEVSMKAAGFDCISYVFPAGEASKTTAEFVRLTEFFARSGLTRGDIAVALGGGVTGDLTGFAAASFLRGIEFIQIPTTLLAMTDSSVGGKTGVNLEAGKNLLGAFHQPSLVICDPEVLDSLPRPAFSAGAAEVIKYGVIRDRELFDGLCAGALLDMERRGGIISRCIGIKRDIVEADEFDNGERQLLNFGHTAAHGIEKQSGLTISHGEAVAMGMVIAAKAAGRIADAGRIAHVNELYGLSSDCPFTAGELIGWCLSDKKKKGGAVTLVLPDFIGKCRLEILPASSLRGFLENGLNR